MEGFHGPHCPPCAGFVGEMNDRFILQQSEVPDWSVLTDTLHQTVIRWQHGRFNETQRITDLMGHPYNDVMQAARAMREIADWLAENHRELL